jgi:hypothetical protein
MAWLHVVRGLDSPSRFALEEEQTVLGRQPDCQVSLRNIHVGRRHAQVTRRRGAFVLQNLHSLSGTYLNLRRIWGLSPLREGDHIHIGGVELAFESRVVPTEAVDSQAMLGRLRCHGKEDRQRLQEFAAACCRQFRLPEESAEDDPAEAARQAIEAATSGLVGRWPQLSDAELWAAYDAAEVVLGQLLRDRFGPVPFEGVVINPSLLSWQDGTVVKLARAIRRRRRFGDIPVLADALEEAGCDSQAILAHCREQGSNHGPNCWVLRLLLKRA